MEFLNSGRDVTIPKSTQSKLKVLSGNTWMAHQLIKEVADKAVFMAWDMAEVARWDVWEGDSSLLSSPPTVPPPARRGETRGGVKIVKHSKNQRSVKEFFSVKTCSKVNLNVLCGTRASWEWESGGDIKTEAKLNKEFRLERVKWLKKYFCNRGDADVRLCQVHVRPEGNVDPKCSRHVKKCTKNEIMSSDMEKVVVPEARVKSRNNSNPNNDSKGGGEEIKNDAIAGGSNRLKNLINFSSPVSKKIFQTKSVSEGVRGPKLFLGVNSENETKIENENENSCYEPILSWRQKLQRFRAPNLDNPAD